MPHNFYVMLMILGALMFVLGVCWIKTPAFAFGIRRTPKGMRPFIERR